MGPAEPQTLLQVVDTLDPHGTPASPALPDEEVHVISRLFEGQASDLRYRRQTWSRYSADCCLIQGNQPELVKLWQTGNDATAIEVVPLLVFFFRRKCSREQSRACQGYSLKCDKRMTNHIFSFDEI